MFTSQRRRGSNPLWGGAGWRRVVWRAFVAIPIAASPEREALLSALRDEAPSVKAVAAGHLHLTLAFLGDVADDAAPALAAALDAAASKHAPTTCVLRAVGAFPDTRRPRVVWAGVADESPLVALAHDVRGHLAEAGFPGDRKAFQPHLTLGRVRPHRDGRDAARFVAAHVGVELGTFGLDHLRLHRSTLGPQGPHYDVVHQAPLGGS